MKQKRYSRTIIAGNWTGECVTYYVVPVGVREARSWIVQIDGGECLSVIAGRETARAYCDGVRIASVLHVDRVWIGTGQGIEREGRSMFDVLVQIACNVL